MNKLCDICLEEGYVKEVKIKLDGKVLSMEKSCRDCFMELKNLGLLI